MIRNAKTAVYASALIAGALLTSSCFDSGGGGGGGGGETRTANDGAGGFLWKPVSESNGQLVILFPPEFTGSVASGEVHNRFPPKSSSLMDVGNYGGVHNGGREHYRFPRQGGAYGGNVFAVAVLKDGRRIGFPIANGALRTD
jgi:hypothetical protein